MKIELFHLPGCSQCTKDKEILQAIVEEAGDVWCEIDVLTEIDRAVELGVLTLPAIAIEGELAFVTLPTPEILRRELASRTRHD